MRFNGDCKGAQAEQAWKSFALTMSACGLMLAVGEQQQGVYQRWTSEQLHTFRQAASNLHASGSLCVREGLSRTWVADRCGRCRRWGAGRRPACMSRMHMRASWVMRTQLGAHAAACAACAAE